MADNSQPGGLGDTYRTLQDAAGKKWPAGVTCYATTVTDGSNVLAVVTPTNGLPVALTSAQLTTLTPPTTVTANIGTVATLATAANQTTGNTSLASIDGKITACNTGAVVLAAGSAAIGSITNTGFSASQAGTWTVQPGNTANTTAWLVTGTGGTFPATQSGTWNVATVSTVTNLSQLGGSAIAMGTGARSSGTQRVTIATDDVVPASQSGTWSVGLSQALDLTNDRVGVRVISGVLDDGAGAALTVKTARGSASSSGVNSVVAAVTGKKIRVLAYSLQADNGNGAVVAANWQDDAGTPVVLSQTWQFAAREGISKALSAGPGFYFQTTSGQALKLNLGSALTVAWEVVYVEG